ncbi:MAG: hypothetical protein HZA88_14920 [Verrucomicrobia bacterium]|nr:hypothetical protein [Verrucomicrobiota bacterium]
MAMKIDGMLGTGSRYGREGVGTLNRVPHLGHGTTEPALTSSIRRYWPQWRQNTEACMVNSMEAVEKLELPDAPLQPGSQSQPASESTFHSFFQRLLWG